MKNWPGRVCMVFVCLILLLPLTGCSNYSRLFRAIRDRAGAGQPTTRQTITERTETTTSRTTRTTTRETTRETQTTTTIQPMEQTTASTAPQTSPSGQDVSRYAVVDGFAFEQGAVTIFVPAIEPDDYWAAPLNEELHMRAVYEQEISQEDFGDDIYYVVDYYYQFDGTCLSLVIENIVGWVDSEGYFSYEVYHYDFARAAFLDNIAYLEHLGLDIDLIAEQVSTYAERNLDKEWFNIRPVEEALFIIFDNILYYEVISLEYEDYWLEDMGTVG